MSGDEVTLPFQATVQATAQGEIWDHTDAKKFEQFGWRTEKNDTIYVKSGPLMGNWNEERFDSNARSQAAALPSQVGAVHCQEVETQTGKKKKQFAHYFQTTHTASYGPRDCDQAVPECLKTSPPKREIRAFPGHQPELGERRDYFETTNSLYGSKHG